MAVPHPPTSDEAAAPGAATQVQTPRGQAIIEILFIVAVFFIAGGEPAPHNNEQHYLCRLKHFWDPEWAPRDFFLGTSDAHFTIVWLAGWVTKLLPLTAVAWAGRLLAWALLAWAWRRLSWAVTPTPWCAVLSAALWVVGIQEGNLAGEWVVGGIEAKCFAYVFVLLALRAYVEDRWRAVWVHLGFASALHVLVGGWSVLILFGLWLRTSDRPPLRTLLPSLAIGGTVALAGVLPPLLMDSGATPAVAAEAHRIYVFDRLPHHLALLSMPDDWLANRAIRHVVVLSLLGGATWWAARGTTSERKGLLRLCRFAWGAAVLMLVGFAIEFIGSDFPQASAGLLRFYWHRLTDIMAPLAVGLTASVAIAEGFRDRRPLSLVWLVTAIAVVVAALGPVTWARWQNPRPPAERRIANVDAWRDVCAWVEANTPADALLLVPKHANSFKWRTGRSEVVSYKDIPQNAAGIVEWKRRLNEVYCKPNDEGELVNVRSLAHHGATRLKELAATYGADYVLTTTQKPISLPVAYRNTRYVVYHVGGLID